MEMAQVSDSAAAAMDDGNCKQSEAQSSRSGIVCFLVRLVSARSLLTVQRVFRYNTASGHILNALAVVCMIASGTIFPLMDVVFGQFVNVFTNFSTGTLSQDGYMVQVGHFTYVSVYSAAG